VIVIMGLSWWLLVHYAPRVLSFVLPGRLTFAIGAALFALGAVAAFMAARFTGQPALYLDALIQAFVGAWLMLAPSAARRGTLEDEAFMRTVAAMLASLLGATVLLFYVPSGEAAAAVYLWLVGFGVMATRHFLRTRSW
jgi:hypothetical protein